MTEGRNELNKNRYLKYEKIRNSKGLIDAQVSEGTGITQSVLSDWKAGRATPGFGNIVRISNFLGVSPSEFEVDSKEGGL